LPIPGAETTEFVPTDLGVNQTTPAYTIPLVIQVLFGLVLIGFIVIWVSGLIRYSDKKQIIRIALIIVVLIVLYFVFPRATSETQLSPSGQAPSVEMPAQTSFDIAPIGDPPVGLIWIVAGLLGIAALAGIIYFGFRTYSEWKVSKALQLEVESALQEVYDGGDLRNIIMRSYQQMMNIMKMEQGIERDAAFTPREFERLLEARGVPAEPIRSLTSLFERVRYGGKLTSEADEREAVACLTSIHAACQVMKGIRS
jgi:hypothetical protein